MLLKLPGNTGMEELQTTLAAAHTHRVELVKAIAAAKKAIAGAKARRSIARIFLIGLFMPSLKETIREKEAVLAGLEGQLLNSFVDIDIHFQPSLETQYQAVASAYSILLTTEKIWDITAELLQDRRVTRSAASKSITRVPVKAAFDNIAVIRSAWPAFHLQNRNGGDLFIYPAFVVISTGRQQFDVIDIHDIKCTFSELQFIEEETIPGDTKTIDITWAKVNKNGTPDRRFARNYQIPVVRYGKVEIISSSGLHELYAFSSYEKCESFVQAFTHYQQALKTL